MGILGFKSVFLPGKFRKLSSGTRFLAIQDRLWMISGKDLPLQARHADYGA